MNIRILFISAFLGLATISFAQSTNTWDKCKWLIGDWVGEGSGQPGQGQGWFSLKEDLSGKVLVRKNHSEYPAANGKPAIIHDDLMIVYTDFSGNPSKAIYFDNEGHTINYSISYTANTITFLSDKTPNVPVFRLTYTSIDNDNVDIKFEMSQDGEKFMTYTDGKCKRKK
ncbi:MAG: hypothetical protein ACHQEB_03745 [Chitinophagales bacterium]